MPSTPVLASNCHYPTDPSGISYRWRGVFRAGPLLAMRSKKLADDD